MTEEDYDGHKKKEREELIKNEPAAPKIKSLDKLL
jgi:hypothetical protein